MKIGIIGCTGRMGKTFIEEVLLNDKTELSGGLVRENSAFAGKDLAALVGLNPIGMITSHSLQELFDKSDAVIDFSTVETSLDAAKIAAEKNKIHVIGTTGFSENDFKKLNEYAENTAIIWSSNMSIGINILSSLVEEVAAQLDNSTDIEILEMHHNHKVDAPSGTAITLGESAAKGRAVSLDEVACKSRDGIIGARAQGEIGFSTIRGGDVVGEHTVIFASDGERIELTHKASSRKIFARGAVRACLWAAQKSPGFYSMKDVLG